MRSIIKPEFLACATIARPFADKVLSSG